MRILDHTLNTRTVLGTMLMCAIGMVASPPTLVYPQTREAAEYQIKAAFLYNFARFVEWPAGSGAGDQTPIIIAIVGDDPFGDTLDQMVHDKSVNGRPFVVRRVKKAEDAFGSQIAFISSSERPRLKSIIRSLEGARILTVSDTTGFAQLGGVINFTMEENKVRFEVNLDAADRAGLKISSKLLNLARIVREQNAQGGR